MDRYIETQAIKELNLHNPLTEEEWGLIYDWEFDRTDHVTFLTPQGKEVEFAKVVRCKDCKHRQHGTSHPLWCNAWCSENDSYWMNKVEADGFCYRGERKEEEDD